MARRPSCCRRRERTADASAPRWYREVGREADARSRRDHRRRAQNHRHRDRHGDPAGAALRGRLLRLDRRPGAGAAPPCRNAAQRGADLDHLINEVADLGESERFAVRGQLRRIIEHSLKLAWSPVQAAASRLARDDHRYPHRPRGQALADAASRFPARIRLTFMTRRDGTPKGRCAPTASIAQRTSCRSDARTAWQTCCGTAGIPKTGTACAKSSEPACEHESPTLRRRRLDPCAPRSPLVARCRQMTRWPPGGPATGREPRPGPDVVAGCWVFQRRRQPQ